MRSELVAVKTKLQVCYFAVLLSVITRGMPQDLVRQKGCLESKYSSLRGTAEDLSRRDMCVRRVEQTVEQRKQHTIDSLVCHRFEMIINKTQRKNINCTSNVV